MTQPPLNPRLFDLDNHLWIMHCAKGPAPIRTQEALSDFLDRELHPWGLNMATEWAGIPNGLRTEAAHAIGASAEDISITTSTSSGLIAVAQGFPWQDGDEVLAPLGEFPSNVWPWKALLSRGVTFREVPIWEGHQSGVRAEDSLPPTSEANPEERLLAAIGPRTRLVAVSWVRFQDGLKLDLDHLGKACRARNIAFVVDGIQGAGTHVPSLQWVDAFACGGQKGFLGPQGHGFLWTSPALRLQMVPQGSWMSVSEGTDLHRTVTDFDRDWLEDGRRLESGSLSLIGGLTLRESLSVLNQVGIPGISAHVNMLQQQLLEILRHSEDWREEAARLDRLRVSNRLGPLLCFHHQGRGAEFLRDLIKRAHAQNIFATAREGYLRIALHGWHTMTDVDRISLWLRGDFSETNS